MESTTPNDAIQVDGATRTFQQWASAQDEYSRLYQSLAGAQAEAYSRASERLMNAQKDYTSQLSNLNEELLGRYREAHATFASKIQDATSRSALPQDEEAYKEFGRVLAALQEEFRSRAEQYHKDLTQAAEQAQRDYHFYNRTAYRKYLEDQRTFWSRLDIESLIPTD